MSNQKEDPYCSAGHTPQEYTTEESVKWLKERKLGNGPVHKTGSLFIAASVSQTLGQFAFS